MAQEVNVDITEKAKQQIDAARKFIENNSNIFKITDLKMHDAFYYTYKAKDEYTHLDCNDEFYYWCDLMYDQFKEDLEEEHINFDNVICRIGHTSSFYLSIYWDDYKSGGVNEVMHAIFEDNFKGWYDFDFKKEKLIHSFSEKDIDAWHIDVNKELDDIVSYLENELMDDIKVELMHSIKILEIINDYKNDQVESFKEYLEEEEYEKAEREQEEEMEHEENMKNLASKILDSIDMNKHREENIRSILNIFEDWGE